MSELRDYVAWENLEPIERARLIRFYPELDKEDVEKERDNG